MIILPISSAKPIQGESKGASKKDKEKEFTNKPANLQHTLEMESESNKLKEQENALDTKKPSDQDFINSDQDKWIGTPFNRIY